MLNYRTTDLKVISPVNYFSPIHTRKNPICNNKPDWMCSLEDIEAQYSWDFMYMKVIKTLRATVEKLLGRDAKKYRDALPLVMKNLYDIEEF